MNLFKVLDKWMTVIRDRPTSSVPITAAIVPAAPLRTRNRGQRGQAVALNKPPEEKDKTRVSVTVFTETDEITNLTNMSCQPCAPIETEFWVGRGGKTLRMQARKAKAAAKQQQPKIPKLKLKIPPPSATLESSVPESAEDPEAYLDPKDKEFKIEEELEADEESDSDDDDDDISMLMRRANNALNRRYRGSEPEIKKIETLEKKAPNSPLKNEVSEMSTGGMNGVVKDEVMDVDELLKDDDDEMEEKKKAAEKKEGEKSLLILQGMADELADDLQKKKEEEKAKEKAAAAKDKENKKDKHRDRDRDKDKSRDRDRDKDRDRSKHRSRDDDKRRKEKEERRRKEKERERQKEKERQEKKRESKPFRESELRNGLDSKEREKIKMVAQRMKDESLLKKDSGSSASLAKIPKLPKKEEVKDEKPKKPGLSFEALMGAMDSGKSGSNKPSFKAPHIKNKNKDLLASFSSQPGAAKSKTQLSKEESQRTKPAAVDYLKNMRTEDKSSKIVPASQFLSSATDKKTEKRPAESAEAPKIKVKSPSQLKESPMFGDFLSTIMKDDQPKKKKIKIAELKAKEEEELREKEKKEREEAEAKAKEEEAAAVEASDGTTPVLSFYRDTLEEPTPPGEDDPLPPGEDAEAKGDQTAKATSSSPGSSPGSSTQDQVSDDPRDAGPRDVRGILVYARGSVRRNRRIVWREDAELVQVEYFELDETERVNVNKIKFEERRKQESELEKSALHQKKQEEARPWASLVTCDFQQPDVEYGSSSVEKVTQSQRENSVLQALYFNNKALNDPSEPENATTIRLETKTIPLIDPSGEETFMNYEDLGWPLPAADNYTRGPGVSSVSPKTDAIFANIQQMMGGSAVGLENGNNRVDPAMVLAAQEAALMTNRFSATGQPPFPTTPMDQAYEPGDEPYEPMDADYGMGFPPQAGLLGGPPPPYPPFSGPPRPPLPAGGGNWNPQYNNFRGSNRGGGFFRGNNRGAGGGPFRGKDKDRKNGFSGPGRRPCKFFTDRGHCREGDKCKFAHNRR